MMDKLLERLIEQSKRLTNEGNVASYIPELSKVNPNRLGICIVTIDGQEYSAGDSDDKFTIQSVSKVANYLLALEDNVYEELNRYIGVLPTARGFNSIMELEMENDHKPLNPMINAGAIATLSFIKGKSSSEKFRRILEFLEEIMGTALSVNEKTYLSEKKTGDRNRALAYYMKSNGIIDGKVEELLDLYFKICSIEVTCREIGRFGAVLANGGRLLKSGSRVVSERNATIAKAVMSNCGMYDESAEFAVDVGIPAKSGVGGGIMAVSSQNIGIGVYGPALDERGNSIAGIEVLKSLSKELDLSVFK